jgi:hypothetical protein
MAELGGCLKRLSGWKNDPKKTHNFVIAAKFAFISRKATALTAFIPLCR